MLKKSLILAILLLTASSASAQRIRILAKGGGQSLSETLPEISLTSPADSATSVSITPSLVYSATNADTCKLNFGTSSPPTANVITQTPCTGSFQPSILSNNTLYYWSVTVTNTFGSVTSSIRSFTTTSSSPSGLLTSSQITCAKMFLGPSIDLGVYSVNAPTAMRDISGVIHYYTLSGTGNIYEFLEPSLQPCNTDPESLTPASIIQDWGTFTVNAQDDLIPAHNAAFAEGLRWDATSGKLVMNWTSTYGSTPTGVNTFAILSLNSGSHTISVDGCFGISGIGMPQVGSGILNIPQYFIDANLPTGTRWGIGFGGGLATVGAGLSLGPTLRAIVPPTTNACASNTNYPISTFSQLAVYGNNATGPTCADLGLGCTPITAPTTPYPAITSLTTYSAYQYAVDWDPYAGHGWFFTQVVPYMDWYKDDDSEGVLAFYQFPSGWINTTVSASPAPTVSGNDVTFTVASTGTHDGGNIQPGDISWIKTCTVGVETGCVADNNDDKSFVVIDTVNTGTKAITGHITSADSGSGDHKPVVGGSVWEGTVYAHGSPTYSRGMFRLQIYNPTQYAAAVAGDIEPYNVLYSEDVNFTDRITGFGSVPTANGVTSLGQHNISSVIADPARKRIIIQVNHGKANCCVQTSAYYIMDVAAP